MSVDEDGDLDQTLEGCDDGNTIDGDGCSSTCRCEFPWTENEPEDCPTACGNNASTNTGSVTCDAPAGECCDENIEPDLPASLDCEDTGDWTDVSTNCRWEFDYVECCDCGWINCYECPGGKASTGACSDRTINEWVCDESQECQ